MFAFLFFSSLKSLVGENTIAQETVCAIFRFFRMFYIYFSHFKYTLYSIFSLFLLIYQLFRVISSLFLNMQSNRPYFYSIFGFIASRIAWKRIENTYKEGVAREQKSWKQKYFQSRLWDRLYIGMYIGIFSGVIC